jgi:predicted transcriptional regulator
MSQESLFQKEINGQYGPFWSEKAVDVEEQAPELYNNIVTALSDGKKGYSDGPFWYKIKVSDTYGKQVIRTRNSFRAKQQDGRVAPSQQTLSSARDTKEILDKISELDNGVQLALAALEQIKNKLGVSNFEPASGPDPIVD